MLPLPILEHLQRLQGAHNVHWIDSSFLADLCAPSEMYNRRHVTFMHTGSFVQSFHVLINIYHQVSCDCLLPLTFDGDFLPLEIVHVSK